MKFLLSCRVFFLPIFFGITTHASAQISALYFTGADSYVDGGITATLSAADGYTINASGNYDGGASLYAESVVPGDPEWDVEFANSTGTQLLPGLYTGATRFPFNGVGTSGLSFFGDGRGDNQDTGEFLVLEADYSDLGVLTGFAADFIQYDETSTYDRTYGSIRFNSTVPLDILANPDMVPFFLVPEPAVDSLFIIGGMVVFAFVCARKRKS